MTLLALLSDRPLTKKRLAQRLFDCRCPGATCTHVRDVEEEIRRLIVVEGRWIVSDGRGYRTAATASEIHNYIQSLEHRRDSLNERIGALRRSVREPVQQASIWDVAA